MATNTLTATLLAMAGQRNVITIPRAFVRFTDSLEAAMMLNQLLYWMPRAHGESVYKTDTDWMDELCLTRYAVRKARDALVAMGFLRVEVHHVKGAPAVHYYIDYEALTDQWGSWLQGQEVKSENELYEPESKVRKRTLLSESSSKTDSVKFENGQTMNHRVPTENLGDDDDGRTLAFLIDQGIGAAPDFAHVPYAIIKADYDARIVDGQSKPAIVRAWRKKEPTAETIFNTKRPNDRAPLQPTRPNYPTMTVSPAEVLRLRDKHNGTS